MRLSAKALLIAAVCGVAGLKPARAHAAAEADETASSPQPSSAEPSSPVALSMEDALARAEKASPLIQRALAATRAVQARSVGAERVMPANPTFSGYVGPRRETQPVGPDQTGTQFGLSIGQSFEIGGKRSARIAVVSKAIETARARERLARVETRARVRATYVAAALARHREQWAQQRVAIAQRMLEAVRALVDEGAASNIDLRLAEIERGSAENRQLEAAKEAQEAEAPLRTMIGLSADSVLQLTTLPDRPPPLPDDLPQLLEQARKMRAELEAFERSKEELDAQLVSLSRQVVPNPSLSFNAQRDLPGQTFWGLGFSIGIPTFRKNQGAREVVRAAKETVDVEREITVRSIELEVANAHRAEALLRRQIDVVDERILPPTEDAERLLREGWRAGKFDLFRVIQASRESWEARRIYYRTLGQLWLATIELDRAVGRL